MLDIQAELHGPGHSYGDLYEAVVALKRRHDLHPCSVRPRDGLSLRNDTDREAVQDLVARFRKLPDDTRHRLPALMNSIGQLQVVIGDLEASQSDFEEVARLVDDPISRAEAHHNTYRAALERGDNEAAFAAYRRAAALDGDTFDAFPTARYEGKRILGASGFGTRFLCLDRLTNTNVAILSLRPDTVDRDAHTILHECRTVQDLDHPAVARIIDAGHAGPESTRPYIATEYIVGCEPLQSLVAQSGPLSPDAWFDIAWQLARALQSLHNRGVLHRCLRPSSILIQPQDGKCRLKLLDVGLGLRRTALHAAASNADRHLSSLGRTVARLEGYLPPELMGRPRGQLWVGPHSDVYGFGRLSAFALTGRPDPDSADRMLLPDAWQKAIEGCTGWTLERRLTYMGPVMDRLASAPGADERLRLIDQSLNELSAMEHDAAVAADPGSPSALAARALAKYRSGDLAGAVEDYTEAIRHAPHDANLYRRRGQVHARVDNADAAISDYTESLRLEPNSVEALSGRAELHSRKGDHEAAAADYTEAMRHAPKDESLYFGRGGAFLSMGQHARAIADYTETARLDPKHLWAIGNRGRCYLMTGEPARALADFTRVLQLDPASIKGHCDRASAHLHLGRADLAIADYSEAIKLEPGPGLYHDRAMAHAAAGQHELAVADLTEALRRSPGNVNLLSLRARAQANAGKLAEALADLDDAARRSDGAPGPLMQRADVLGRLGRRAEALADLDAAIKATPDNPFALFQRGNLHAEMGEDDRAIADYSELIRLDADAASGYCNRGISYARLGEFEDALADLDRAVAINPGDPLTLSNRASVNARLGRVKEAAADFTEVLRLDPVNADALSGRGFARRELGDLDGALDDFTRAGAAYNQARVLLELGRHTEAVGVLDNLLNQDGGDVDTLILRGRAHLEMGDILGAIADNEEAARMSPDDARVANNLAWLLAITGDGERALPHAERACTAGEDPARLDTLAAALAACGRYTEAAAAQERAIGMAAKKDRDAFRVRLEMYQAGLAFVRKPPEC